MWYRGGQTNAEKKDLYLTKMCWWKLEKKNQMVAFHEGIGYLEDHPMTCKWLIAMVIVSPPRIGLWDPFQIASN